MRCAEYDLYSFVFANDRSRFLEFAEHLGGQPERIYYRFVVFARSGVHQPRRGGVCVLVALDARELIHQILRNHQEIRHAVESARELVGIELIDSIERLELNAGVSVKAGEGDYFVHSGDDPLCAAIAVGEAGHDLRVALHEHVINAPRVYGEAHDIAEFGLGFFNALFNMKDKGFDIPYEMPVKLLNAVREAVDLLCAKLAVLPPADDMPPA